LSAGVARRFAHQIRNVLFEVLEPVPPIIVLLFVCNCAKT
jgi:hypothetical protein